MYGNPCGLLLHPFLSPIGLPCERPRWGFSAGIDLKTMKITWMRRNGTIRDVAPLSVPPLWKETTTIVNQFTFA